MDWITLGIIICCAIMLGSALALYYYRKTAKKTPIGKSDIKSRKTNPKETTPKDA